MKIAARRRLAVGVVATTSALLAGVLIAPPASAGQLTISPNAVVNTQTVTLTFNETDADFVFGGEAVFTRVGTSASFRVPIEDATGDEGTATVDFSDPDTDEGVGKDGPADAGVYNVTVTGAGDPITGNTDIAGGGTDSCVSCFTVLSPGPIAVSSVAPNSLRPGNQGNVSILGNNFERSTRIEVLFADGSVDPTITTQNPPTTNNANDGTAQTDGVTTRTELKRRFNVGSGSSPGSRDIRVTNLDGTTAVCSACFFVAGAPLTSSNPTGAFNDPGQAPTAITFNGTNVTNGTPRLEFVGNPGANSRSQLSIIGTNVRNYTGTSITADFDLANAAPGSNAYQPFVQGDNGIVNACDTCRFTVIQRDTRTPTLTGLDRSTEPGVQKNLRQGETATFVATGTNFSKGATLVFSPPEGLTVTASEFISPEQMNITIAATNEATAGDKNVQARLTDGKTSPACNACLTVTPASGSPAPTTSASPTGTASPTATATASPGAGDGDNARYAGLQTPVRVLDTRSGSNPQRRRGEIRVNLSQQITDPNATAVVLNVTVTNPSARGFLVAYPTGTAKPGTSNVNFDPNQTQANEVVVALPADKRVSLFVDSADAHVIADMVGHFTTATSTDTGRIATRSPVRAEDTRNSDQRTRTGEIIVDLTNEIPEGSTDAILNVTVTEPSARGFVVAYPTGTERPKTSNVNFERGQTQANEVISKLGTGANARKVSLFVDSARAAVIVDVVGAVLPGTVEGTQVFTALDRPTRAINTRDSNGQRRSGDVNVTMPAEVPSNASGVVLNVTATNGTRPGFVTVYPTGSARPETSNVNFRAERQRTATQPASAGTQANEVISQLGNNRQVTLFIGGANTPQAHVIVDVVGYLTGGATAGASGSPTATSSPGGGGGDCDPISETFGLCEPEPGPSGSATPSATASGSATPSATASATASATPSATASASAAPTASGTASPTATATAAAEEPCLTDPICP